MVDPSELHKDNEPLWTDGEASKATHSPALGTTDSLSSEFLSLNYPRIEGASRPLHSIAKKSGP